MPIQTNKVHPLKSNYGRCMLYLWCAEGQRIIIGDDIIISNQGLYTDKHGKTKAREIKIGIKAPEHVKIKRLEVLMKNHATSSDVSVQYKQKKKITLPECT